MKERFKVISAVYVLLVEENKVLLLRRCNTGYEDGNYSLPAGHLEGDEELKKAMVREAHEEIGIEIDENDLDLACVMHRKTESKENERLDFFFTAKKWQGKIKNMEPHKCDELKWYDLDDLPQNVIPYIGKAIKDYKASKILDYFGW